MSRAYRMIEECQADLKNKNKWEWDVFWFTIFPAVLKFIYVRTYGVIRVNPNRSLFERAFVIMLACFLFR